MNKHEQGEGVQTQRPFIGMHFRCCHAYGRIYLNAAKQAYIGACPRCGASIRINAKPGGSKSKFWSAS